MSQLILPSQILDLIKSFSKLGFLSSSMTSKMPSVSNSVFMIMKIISSCLSSMSNCFDEFKLAICLENELEAIVNYSWKSLINLITPTRNCCLLIIIIFPCLPSIIMADTKPQESTSLHLLDPM